MQRKPHIKIELSVKLSLLRLCHVDHVVQSRRSASRLLGTNGFHVKAKSETFSATSSRCRQNLKYENFTSSFGRLRQNIAAKSVPHVQHDCFSSFNQSNLSLTLPSSNLQLPTVIWVQLSLPATLSFSVISSVSLLLPWLVWLPLTEVYCQSHCKCHCCSIIINIRGQIENRPLQNTRSAGRKRLTAGC